MIGAHPDAEAHANYALFARAERGEGTRRRAAEIRLDRGVDRRYCVLVFDEVAEPEVVLVADRRFERQRLFGDLEHMPHLSERHVESLGNLAGRRLATDLVEQAPTR